MIDLIKIFAVSVFLVFCLSLLYNAVKLQWRRRMERKGQLEVDDIRRIEREAIAIIKNEPAHTHDWRKLNEFIKQCRGCKQFEFSETLPEGIQEFLLRMPDPRSNCLICPDCKRSIPQVRDFPQRPWNNKTLECPYCGFDLTHWDFKPEEKN